MTLSRVDQLLEFHKQDPDDPFPLYALALEYIDSDQPTAKLYFDKLLLRHKEYLPTYYKSAELYIEIGNTQKAKTLLEDGIKLAEKLSDHKTKEELKNALANLLFADD